MNEEQKAYVKSQREAGFSDEEIKTALEGAGYPEDLVARLLVKNETPVPPQNQMVPQATNNGGIDTSAVSPRLIDIGELLGGGLDGVFKNIRLLGGLIVALILSVVLLMLSSVVLGFVSTVFLGGMGGAAIIFFPLVFLLLILALFYYLSVVTAALFKGVIENNPQGKYWSYVRDTSKIGISVMLVSFYFNIMLNIGMSLLIIPGIIAFVYLGFALFALVDEDRRGFVALARSVHLVRGHFLGVLLRAIILLVVSIVLLFLFGFAFGFIGAGDETVAVLMLLAFVPFYALVLFWLLNCRALLYNSLKRINTAEAFDARDNTTLIWVLRIIIILAFVLVIAGFLVVFNEVAGALNQIYMNPDPFMDSGPPMVPGL